MGLRTKMFPSGFTIAKFAPQQKRVSLGSPTLQMYAGIEIWFAKDLVERYDASIVLCRVLTCSVDSERISIASDILHQRVAIHRMVRNRHFDFKASLEAKQKSFPQFDGGISICDTFVIIPLSLKDLTMMMRIPVLCT